MNFSAANLLRIFAVLCIPLLVTACNDSPEADMSFPAPAAAGNVFVAQSHAPGIYDGKTSISTNAVREGVPELIVNAFPK